MGEIGSTRVACIQVWGGGPAAGLDVRIDFVSGGFVVGQLINQDAVNAVFANAGIENVDVKPFLPHITNARYSPVQGTGCGDREQPPQNGA